MRSQCIIKTQVSFEIVIIYTKIAHTIVNNYLIVYSHEIFMFLQCSLVCAALVPSLVPIIHR